MRNYTVLLFLPVLLAACRLPVSPDKNTGIETGKPASTPLEAVQNPETYWFQGKAELGSYTVEQERYGEIRRAGQVMVFVTEDFSANKQVKLDGAPAPGDTRVPVLKLNTIRRFDTGIYDYSVEQSVFTPLPDGAARSLKVTTSIQDWCGHVFVQLNAHPDAYQLHAFSYFEREGDVQTTLQADLLEDEIWTRLRLAPESLPGNQLKVLPAVVYSRFRHKPLAPETANITLEKGDQESTLLLQYTSIPRELRIRYETAFPHRILGWEETSGGTRMSKGMLNKIMLDAYWQHNDNASAPLREQLNPGF